MSEQQARKVWLGIALVVLIATYPSWLNPKAQASAGYDAPWVYPGLNPAVNH
ncbi:MAG: hypothetical protein L0Z53_22725 [Acidobacteriales bacterium]|nr:hypothetical protein [Terriglobales bacterium]